MQLKKLIPNDQCYAEALNISPRFAEIFHWKSHRGKVSKITQELPSGWREISHGKYIQFLTSGLYSAELYEQFWKDREGNPLDWMVEAYMHLGRDGTGIAFSPTVAGATIVGAKYFAFGCSHRYRELSRAECEQIDVYHAGACYHVEVCEVCGHLRSYDSSD